MALRVHGGEAMTATRGAAASGTRLRLPFGGEFDQAPLILGDDLTQRRRLLVIVGGRLRGAQLLEPGIHRRGSRQPFFDGLGIILPEA